jgi:hypothetical protein
MYQTTLLIKFKHEQMAPMLLYATNQLEMQQPSQDYLDFSKISLDVADFTELSRLTTEQKSYVQMIERMYNIYAQTNYQSEERKKQLADGTLQVNFNALTVAVNGNTKIYENLNAYIQTLLEQSAAKASVD